MANLHIGSSLNWDPFSGPFYEDAIRFGGLEKGPYFRELPIYRATPRA